LELREQHLSHQAAVMREGETSHQAQCRFAQMRSCLRFIYSGQVQAILTR